MSHYLIEFRFQGNAKHEIKSLIWQINKQFHIFARKRAIPHITIIAPFYTAQEGKLVHDFKKICEKHPLIKFWIEGYGTFEGARVVYVNINPSQQLVDFRNELLNTIKRYGRMCPTDVFSILGLIKLNRNYHPHATLAMRLGPQKFHQIKEYARRLKPHKYEHNLLRATLIKDNIILHEYDFIQRRLLNRRQAKDGQEFHKTINLFKEGKFSRKVTRKNNQENES